MNCLDKADAELFFSTIRILMDYSNRQFHIDDKADFLHDEGMNPNSSKKAVDKIWENPALIDDILRTYDLSEEQRSLLSGWKNCVPGTFTIERHLKDGSIFVGPDDKIYQVVGITDPIKDMFERFPMPVIVKTALLPFRDVIIADGLFSHVPLIIGPGIRSGLKEAYMNAKKNQQIIRQLPKKEQEAALPSDPPSDPPSDLPSDPPSDPPSDLPSDPPSDPPSDLPTAPPPAKETKAQKTAPNKKGKKPTDLYRLKVYPNGNGRSIYRIIEISGNATLEKLCAVIMDAFDFIHEHSFEFLFSDNETYQSHPYPGERSAKVHLNTLNLVPKQKFFLHYDFGDDWMFTIRVESDERGLPIKPRVIKSMGSIEQYPDSDGWF